MLSSSAFARVVVLLVAAAVMAGIVQHYMAQPGENTEPPRTEAARPTPSSPGTLKDAPARDPIARRAPQEAAPSAPSAAPPRADPAPAPAGRPDTAQAVPADEATEEPAQDQAAAPPRGDDAAEPGETGAADPSQENAGDLVDLNTGTLAQLNGLKGGGAIGRAIIQRRPYSSVEQLISKRVLNRSTFQRIKDQVTVR